MSEEVKPEVIKKTQTSLGKYIKKPPLTEKLLKKPPFRFLHDIVSAIIKETGFLENLFTEDEMKAEIKDKEAKMAYLTKLINVIKLVTGIELSVRPAKIVSGQEPTKTNELLQAIAKALDKKISSTEAVEHYKQTTGLEKNSQNSPSRHGGQVKAAATSRRSNQAKKSTEQHEKSSKSTKSLTETGGVAGRASRRQGEKREEIVEEKAASGSTKTHRSVKKLRTIDENAARTKDAKGKNSSSTVRTSKPSAAAAHKESLDQIRHPSSTTRSESTPIIAEREKTREEENSQNIGVAESIVDIRSDEPKADVDAEKSGAEPPAKPETNRSTAGELIVPLIEESKVPEQQVSSETIKSSVSDQPVSMVKSFLRPPSVRPSSARPAAPKIRWKPEFTMKNHEPSALMENEQAAATAAVMLDNFDSPDADDDADDDKESMVVVETETEYATNNEAPGNFNADISNQEHGYLVAQILETQRELANTTTVDLAPGKIDTELEVGSKKNNREQQVVKEVDKLRGTIQTLTRATNPMGKLLDCWQEDVELMQKELLDWRNQYAQVHDQLEMEKAACQAAVKPMEESLEEINAAIKAQLDQIYQIKLNIMKNNQKIQQLLDGRS